VDEFGDLGALGTFSVVELMGRASKAENGSSYGFSANIGVQADYGLAKSSVRKANNSEMARPRLK
jgi:hypothetical protein